MQETTSRNGDRRTLLLRLFLIMALVAVSAYLYRQGFFALFLSEEKILAFLDSLGRLSFVGFIFLQAAQVVFAPIPGEFTGLIGGYSYGLLMGTILSSTGLIIGSLVAFLLSRFFGKPFVERLVSKATLDRFDYLLHSRGLFITFLLFFLPGFPKDYLCFILGLGRISILEFLAVSSIGRLFGTFILTLGGGYLRQRDYTKLAVLAGLCAVVCLVVYLLRRHIEALFKAIERREAKALPQEHPKEP